MLIRTKSRVWKWEGNGAWHFATLDPKTAKAVKQTQEGKKRIGRGSVPVVVTLGETSWRTSVFPDTKRASYLLPLKAAVRKKEGIAEGDTVALSLQL
ncbi:MAG: DUF1905 domain-containing protein [Candidatus Paceibacterota bacterium]